VARSFADRADSLRLVDPVLTNIAQEYRGQDYIADMLFPTIPVSARAFEYPIFGKEAWIDNRAIALRVAGEEPQVLLSNVTTGSATTIDRWIATAVDDTEMQEATPGTERLTTMAGLVEYLMEQKMLWLEADAAEIVMNSGLYVSGNTSSPGTKWDAAGGDFQGDFVGALEVISGNVGAKANTVLMSPGVWYSMLKNSQFLAPNANAAVVGPPDVRTWFAQFGINRVLVGEAFKMLPADSSVERLWGTEYFWLGYVAQSVQANIRRPSFGYKFARSSYPQIVPERNAYGGWTKVRVWSCERPVVTSYPAAYLFSNVLA